MVRAFYTILKKLPELQLQLGKMSGLNFLHFLEYKCYILNSANKFLFVCEANKWQINSRAFGVTGFPLCFHCSSPLPPASTPTCG